MEIKKITKTSFSVDNILRFNTNAGVKVFVTQGDIEDNDKYKSIISQNISDNEKILQLKEVASEIAYEKLEELNVLIRDNLMEVQISVESLSASSIDFERINWTELLHPEEEEF